MLLGHIGVAFAAKAVAPKVPLRAIPGVMRVEQIGERVVVYGQKEGPIGGVANTLEANGVRFADLRAEQPTLEDVFLALTGREMRD